ncbi:uncharacterized protein LOC117241820 [Bombus vosnesenskii]|uniref:Uncharacterized protein LOC117241820 n=4 Tax=Pyrobombus TaxID=144703 RepID=A0A6J3LE51_9HYME|nr:uncharacterized protein LOC112213762 [Bombus impatiens]XP_033308916.1 uncharacterized protein LOC117210219 [Bombus bifarius]XP_033363863.1 uncharacterized protein LOC117241820 [Bombus vosnesenskii]
MYYTIQITNYGQSINDVLSFSREIFWNFITTNTVFKNSVIATVCSQNEYSDSQETLDIYFVSNRLSLVHSKKNVNLINFLYQKAYLSFVIKDKLIFSDREKFTNIILNEIILLQQFNFHIKFMVHINQNMLYCNHITLDNHYRSCHVLAIALSNVIKHSSSIEFKENCFSMLNVENSHEVEAALMIKLIPLIHQNYSFSSINQSEEK